jgi:probable HAF family extracellular repeat protein
MTPSHRRQTLVLVFSLLVFSTGTLFGQASYRVNDLGTIGGTSSAGNSINDFSLVSGTSTIDASDSVIHASLWAYGRIFDLGTLGGPNSAVLWPDHNIFGVISGVSETADMDPLGEAWSCSAFFPSVTGHVCLGFVWRWGSMTALPTLGGTNGYAAGDNNLGQIVGWAETTVHDSTCITPQVLQFEAAQWDAGTGVIHELPPLPGDPDGAATSINDRDQAVGISGICYDAVGAATAEHMVLWEHGKPKALPALGGSDWNTPTDINDLGQVTGFADLPGDSPTSPNFHAFFWSRETGTIDLGTLSGDVYSEGLGLNNKGQVVGESCSAGFALCRAFIWEHGKMSDLNKLVASGSSLYLNFANDINDLGEIAGGATDSSNSTTPAFVAIPQGANDWDSSVRSRSEENPPQMPEYMRETLARRFGMKLSELK